VLILEKELRDYRLSKPVLMRVLITLQLETKKAFGSPRWLFFFKKE